MPATTSLIGQRATDFTLTDQGGTVVSLASFRGKRSVLLIFYPGDDTAGCTKQLCAIRDAFETRGVAVLGVNHAGADSHQKFVTKYGLNVPLLIDEGMKVSKAYGAFGKFFGHDTIKRSVVLIDTDGVIRYLKRGLPSNREILEAIDAL